MLSSCQYYGYIFCFGRDLIERNERGDRFEWQVTRQDRAATTRSWRHKGCTTEAVHGSLIVYSTCVSIPGHERLSISTDYPRTGYNIEQQWSFARIFLDMPESAFTGQVGLLFHLVSTNHDT